MKRIITAVVQNRSGVLNRVTGLMQKRQFNIESISVGRTETEGISKMTFVVHVDDHQKLEQLTKQLNKQIDVLKVTDLSDKAIVARELALIKVVSNAQLRNEIQGIIEPFRASIIDVSKDSLAIQVTGKPDKIEALIELLRPYGIKDIARTGLTAFARGHQPQVTEFTSYSILK
ncbi:acetolactate synthase small subunit [Salipaludibacillus agaradhaerens]|jgi:acetolactate synthase-1/3 small subunit|uniref:Acetolactate synthase small subunit n=1 Tax=Salipaludibacillus agaradhaerens TaxID=76935 RepID=A0A9Q4B2K9_SALAG|nr:acetolactate synthase small subunit [Salipaludibacillus agaradhaerens]UJW57250.1 acetolactate synthase small subunit [Bacillus sp. A116_S68]MCR6097076.1 acetolactate synthase small subunit [Salipaludibacillus agaradhaerens]MCR6106091.1 acetolactate synthase small subunit [Salipaludibacillus agaradhaerens]MCR6113439.1 acetolactate synthase small subunit [Salipaludibacillus agaradhaerens]MCR6118124.1 acetolactate synthase small subunit [Salipaludibacillus agaradhaerens]